MKLRPYQKKAVEAVLEGRNRGLYSMLIQSATGTGKTVILSEIFQQWPKKGPLLYLAHLGPLIEQTAERLKAHFPDARVEIEKAESRASKKADVIIGSVPTVGRENSTRLDRFSPALICADEAHHSVSLSNRRIYEALGVGERRGPTLIGLTATPRREDKENLNSVFQEQVFSYPLLQAIKDEWLSDIIAFQAQTDVDLDEVDTSGGDFNIAELAQAVNVKSRTKEAYRHWFHKAAGRPTAIFCVNITHAEKVADFWEKKVGKRVCLVHSKLPKSVYNSEISAFRRGESKVLVNVGMIGEGWDYPPLSCIVMLRPTKSLTLYTQIIGRGTRGGRKCPVKGKENLLIIDMADNCTKHNLASITRIIGLPTKLNLEGASLLATAEMLEELGNKAAWIDPPETVTDLKTILKQIDLFVGDRLPPEVEEHSAYPWVKRLDGSYIVGCGKALTENRFARDPDRMVNCKAELCQDLIGTWHFTLWVGTVKVVTKKIEGDVRKAFTKADMTILDRFPNSYNYSIGAPWRYEKISKGQITMLVKLGVAESEAIKLTKGEASTKIDALLAKGGTRRGQR